MLERAKSYRKLAEKAYRKLVDERAARLRTLTRSMAGRLGNLPDVGDATLDRAQWSCRPFWQPFFLRSRPSGAHSSAMSSNMVAASVSLAAAASLAQSADRSRNHSTFKFTSTLRMTRLHQHGCHDSDPKSFSNSQNWRKLSRITGRGRDGIGYVFKNGARLCSPMRRDGKPSDDAGVRSALLDLSAAYSRLAGELARSKVVLDLAVMVVPTPPPAE
jgi:hypothetical protein